MKARPGTKSGRVVLELSHSDEAILESAHRQSGPQCLNFKTILVPVDFSECSTKALTYAVPFAKQLGAKLHVLYVVPPYYAVDPYGLSECERIHKELRVAGEEKLGALLERHVPKDLRAIALVRHGNPATEIVDAARDLEIDLIIISTHGHTGLKHMLLGSTTENVVRRAPCLVLTVRDQEHEFISN